jgi:hypothetical protein
VADLMLTVPATFFASSAAAPSISFRTSASDSTDLTTYNGAAFQGLDFGTEGANRHVIVGIIASRTSGSPTISGVTIGGVAATIVAQITEASRGIAGIAIAAVPTGATGDVVVTMSGACSRCAIIIWAAYDLTSATPADTATSTASPLNVSCDTAIGDVMVACGYSNNSTTATHAGVTERVDAQYGEGATYAGGDHTAVSAETPRTITITFASSANPAGAAAVFR